MFRLYNYNKDCRKTNIICKNGAVYYSVYDYEDFSNKVDSDDNRDLKIDGEIIRTCEDIENEQVIMIVVKDDDKYKLKYLHN